jgi:glycosyltransferase involved in cell wall biosynthesis
MEPARVSVLLLACNQAATVRAAAESVLAQTGPPLEIVFSDDASSDDSFAVLASVAAGYRGPHRLRLRRNDINLGIGAHYNRLLAETSGELLVTAAGDDVSVPHRVARLVAAWDASGRRADLVASHYLDMAPDGSLGGEVAIDDLGALTLAGWCAHRPFTVGATHAFTRRLMDRFGPFIEGIWYEDPIVALRAVLAGGALTVPEPLVHYRRGGTSKWPRIGAGRHLVDWVATQNRRVLAEIEQFTRDAVLAGRGSEVIAALAPVRARERYLAGVLAARDTAERWQALRRAADLPLDWRVRKFLTFTFPERAAAIKRWRQGRRSA